MNSRMQVSWICCQLGAREHYAVARALHSVGSLSALVTEAWVPPTYPPGWGRRMRERFHVDLTDASVHSWNFATISFELGARVRRRSGWSLILDRNRWFQQHAVDVLTKLSRSLGQTVRGTPSLFAYSYAALDLLRFCKQRRWRTILGQIDPGPMMQNVADQLACQYSEVKQNRMLVPQEYWDQWREECTLADQIVVNSAWARTAIMKEGIPSEKINILPVAYMLPPQTVDFRREYPASFDRVRPLHVLFLGQVTLLKGIIPLLEAALLLEKEPVRFSIVGAQHVQIPDNIAHFANVSWIGQVHRGKVSQYYQEADVFVFPSFSDGFGLTQLEAQAWKLPVIASRFCGDVVHDGINGILLSEVSGKAIADVVLNLLHNPYILKDMAAHSGIASQFTLESLASSLLNL